MEIRETAEGTEFVGKKITMRLSQSVKTHGSPTERAKAGSTTLEVNGQVFRPPEINVVHEIMSLFTLRQLIEIKDLCMELDPEDWAHLRDMLRDWPDALERFRTEDAPASPDP